MAVPVFMIITGYLMCLSFESRHLSLSECYLPLEILSKWLRFIIPFIPAWILAVLARVIGNDEAFTINRLIIDFITGGQGRGSYYFPVMLQVVLLIPIICWLIKSKPISGIIVIFAINIIFEALKTWLNMSPELYRICSLRYLFALGFGCFLFFHSINRRELKWYIIIGIIGFGYIVTFNYFGLQPVITDQWTTTSVFATLYLVPIMVALIGKTNIRNRVIDVIGRASFNVFLVQMVFYFAGDAIVYRFIPVNILRVLIIILICCFVGVLYYKIESPFTQRIVQKIRANGHR